ncbi:MAG: CBS domain-containing protein [Anaerolineae bacterium]
MKEKLVKDWMTRQVITISPDTPLTEAHRLMAEKQIRRLPIMKNSDLVGIVTRGDVREAEPSSASSLTIWEMNYLLAKLKVKQVMSRNAITISHNATIAKAAKLMMDHKISGLPVVNDSNKVVGIITESDIFRMVVQGWSR